MAGTVAAIRRLINATRYSLRGLRAAWHQEPAFRQELGLVLVLLPLAVWLGRTPTETALLGASCLLVLIVELVNTAVEAVVDRMGETPHPLAGLAKDAGSAAVLLSLLLAVFVWLSILLPRLASH